MSNRKLEIACITLYMSPGHKTILWVKNLVTKNRRVYPSLESKRTISLNRMLVYCRLWWPPLGVSQDFFTLSDRHFSLEWKDALHTGMGESHWALLHERLKGSGQSSISAIYVLIANIFVILVLAIEAQQSWSGLKLVISIKSLASSGHLCLLRRVFYTAVGLTLIGKYQIFPFLGSVTGGGWLTFVPNMRRTCSSDECARRMRLWNLPAFHKIFNQRMNWLQRQAIVPSPSNSLFNIIKLNQTFY